VGCFPIRAQNFAMSGYERLSREDGDVAIELSQHSLPNESTTQQHDLER
jgi:hypothetical protein